MEKVNFQIDNATLVDEKPESSFSILSFDFFASGKNKNNFYVSEETLLRTAHTIKNVPLVWEYDPILDDAYTHTDTEVPCGFIPENAEIKSRLLDDGRLMLSVNGYVWKRYSGKILDFFIRDGEKPVSVEVSVFETGNNRSDGLIELLDYKFEAITVLGNNITPAIPLARASIIQFSNEYFDALSELNYKSANKYKIKQSRKLISFPYQKRSDMNPALRGIDPPISISQANEIARQADAIGTDNEKNGWAIAISNFKKTHRIKDGKWVKREKEENSVNDSNINWKHNSSDVLNDASVKEEVKVTEEEQIEQELKEETPDSEQENKDIPVFEGQVEHPEENVETSKEDAAMSLDPYLDVDVILTLLKDEVDDYDEIVEEFSHPSKMNHLKVMKAMCAYMIKYSQKYNAALESLEAYMAENKKLKDFKDQKDAEQFNFQVDATLKEIEERTEIPVEEILALKEKSKEFSLENFHEWRTLARSVGLDFAEKKEDNNSVRYALPIVNQEVSYRRSPWAR